jgi:hypothetical protein
VINTKVSKVNIYYNKLITNIIVKEEGRKRGRRGEEVSSEVSSCLFIVLSNVRELKESKYVSSNSL